MKNDNIKIIKKKFYAFNNYQTKTNDGKGKK